MKGNLILRGVASSDRKLRRSFKDVGCSTPMSVFQCISTGEETGKFALG